MKKVILIDGTCNLCNGFIKIVYRNSKNKFYYGTINDSHLMKKDDSIAFQEDKTIWRGPEAIIKILIHMDGGYKILGKAFKFIPKFLIRYGYKIVANNRYKIFGKKESCDITNSINPKYIIQHEEN